MIKIIFVDFRNLMSGILSLGASDRLVKLIGAVYWFTVEFGLIKEEGEMKFYGAGVASSVNEIKNAMSNDDLRLLRLDIDKPPLDFVVEGIQPFFYYIESFSSLFDQLNHLRDETKKPFKFNIDPNSLRIEVDRRINLIKQ